MSSRGIAVLIALELIAGRHEVWLPRRWRRLELAGDKQQRFISGLMKLIRRLERISRPRLSFLFQLPFHNQVVGLFVIAGAAAAFLAPPFSGLDTLPALAVVLFSIGVLLKDILIVIFAVALGIAGVVLEICVGCRCGPRRPVDSVSAAGTDTGARTGVAMVTGHHGHRPAPERRPNYDGEYGSNDSGCEPAGAEAPLSPIIGE
jgi:Exopolysaccharide synthesis, ExoD